MTLTVGRIDLGSTVQSVQRSGPARLTISGRLPGASLTAEQVLASNIVGLADNRDEPVVPVTYTSDADVDGFYRVVGSQVQYGRGGLVALRWPYQIDLELVDGYAAPLMETAVIMAVRSGTGIGSAITDVESMLALPSSPNIGLDEPAQSGHSTGLRRVDADHDVACYFRGNLKEMTTSGDTAQGTVTWVAPTDGWYEAGCAIEADHDGDDTWRALVGHQLPKFQTLVADQALRLSNGLVRVSYEDPDVSSTNYLALNVEFRSEDGTTWRTASTYEFKYDNGSVGRLAVGRIDHPTILRNSPEEVTVRYTFQRGSADTAGNDVGIILDVTLQRGHRLVLFHLREQLGGNAGPNTSGKWVLEASDESGTGANVVEPDGSGTVLGAQRNADDGNSERWCMFTAHTCTVDTVNLRITQSVAHNDGFHGAIGRANSDGDTDLDEVADLIEQYLGLIATSTRVVER